MRRLVQAQSSGKPVAVKMLCYRKDGSPFWGYLFSCPLASQVMPWVWLWVWLWVLVWVRANVGHCVCVPLSGCVGVGVGEGV